MGYLLLFIKLLCQVSHYQQDTKPSLCKRLIHRTLEVVVLLVQLIQLQVVLPLLPKLLLQALYRFFIIAVVHNNYNYYFSFFLFIVVGCLWELNGPPLRTFAPKSSYGEIFFISRLGLGHKVLTPKMKKKKKRGAPTLFRRKWQWKNALISRNRS